LLLIDPRAGGLPINLGIRDLAISEKRLSSEPWFSPVRPALRHQGTATYFRFFLAREIRRFAAAPEMRYAGRYLQ
jgi:hypothetical protein